MRDLIEQIETWVNDNRSLALATVIKTWGSSPRQAGAGMAVSDQGEIAGSVSGGCVEGAVIDAAQRVLSTGVPERLHFGVGDDQAWEVGLSCGGEIDVFIRQFGPQALEAWKTALSHPDLVWVNLFLEGERDLRGSEIVLDANGVALSQPSTDTAPFLQMIKDRPQTGIYQTGSPGIGEIFMHRMAPPPELVLVGGAHIAIPLAGMAKLVGFDVTVVDPRKLFSRKERFPDIKSLLPLWPETAFQHIRITGSTAIVMLTHDPKIDDPALKIALDSPAFYVGALGSRKTHQRRIDRLTEAGVDRNKIGRIQAPVGLDLGGKKPAEIALGIMAQILQTWYGGGESP